MEYRINIKGHQGVGKTAFLMRHLTGDFKTVPEAGVYFLFFNSNYGPICFECYDGDLHADPDGTILMFSVTDPTSFNMIRDTQHDGLNVICGNKIDLVATVSSDAIGAYFQQSGYQCYFISSKSTYNYDKPFVTLARQLSGLADLTLE